MFSRRLKKSALAGPAAWLLGCGMLAASLCLVAAHGSRAQAPTGPVVAVTGGQIQGQFLPGPGGAVFKGIPYGAPPVGALRWRETQPVAPWTGVLQASAFRPGCGEVPRDGSPAKGNIEDCLYLNVWAPDWPPAGKPKAVMLWINGGELAGGSGALKAGAESLARHGVILVSANYRGLLLGMMAHPELTAESPHHASGNYGQYDEIAVLHWIHDNIAKFGGDPNNVTIMGQSGGAHMVSMLMSTPLTKGLIHRAIIHSGSPFQSVRPFLTEAEMEEIGKVTAQLVHAPATDQINFMRSLPASTFDNALGVAVRTELLKNHGGQAYDEGADGYVIPYPTTKVWQEHKELAIPLMVGSTGVDSSSAPAGVGNLPKDATPEQTLAWEKTLLEYFYPHDPDLLKQAEQIYGLTPGPNQISSYPPYGKPDLQLGVDLNHRCSVGMTSDVHSAIAPTYQWEFTITTPGHPASHGSELRYVFGYDEITDPAERKQADIMQQYWTNFAKTGDPNGPGLPAWNKYDPANKQSMELTNDGPVLKPQPRQAACAPYVAKYTRHPTLMWTGAALMVRGAGGAM
ncbi:MAG TPA: carboxylesterase family protein [Caulobacteraceae bacterium]|nr:carboxylesterase family protein [Caulobacteraceae bacterium]